MENQQEMAKKLRNILINTAVVASLAIFLAGCPGAHRRSNTNLFNHLLINEIQHKNRMKENKQLRTPYVISNRNTGKCKIKYLSDKSVIQSCLDNPCYEWEHPGNPDNYDSIPKNASQLPNGLWVADPGYKWINKHNPKKLCAVKDIDFEKSFWNK